jgi:hypothetical protein
VHLVGFIMRIYHDARSTERFIKACANAATTILCENAERYECPRSG